MLEKSITTPESKLIECVTCANPVKTNEFQKKIFFRNHHFCSEKCMDMCCAASKILIGIVIIGSIFIFSFWFGSVILPFMMFGLPPLYCGLRGSKNCIFTRYLRSAKDKWLSIEEEFTEINKL